MILCNIVTYMFRTYYILYTTTRVGKNGRGERHLFCRERRCCVIHLSKKKKKTSRTEPRDERSFGVSSQWRRRFFRRRGHASNTRFSGGKNRARFHLDSYVTTSLFFFTLQPLVSAIFEGGFSDNWMCSRLRGACVRNHSVLHNLQTEIFYGFHGCTTK